MLIFCFVCCTELSTRYEFTQESNSSAKQEADQLKEEVKVMSAQLLRQHNASLDSQVREGAVPLFEMAGFVRVIENLESHGILEFHFPGLESHGN